MNYYTIVLLLPERLSSGGPPPYYLAYIQADTVLSAVELARDKAVTAYTKVGYYLTPGECRHLVSFNGYAPLAKE